MRPRAWRRVSACRCRCWCPWQPRVYPVRCRTQWTKGHLMLRLCPAMNDAAFQKCTNPQCGATFGIDEVLTGCTKCRSLLDIGYDWNRLPVPRSLAFFEHRWMTKG